MSDAAASSPLEAFRGRIEPTKVPFYYRIALGIVALAMIVLPIIYIALIIAAGWAVWWHLKNDLGVFSHVRGRGAILALVVYLGPAVAGAIFVLFLIKPLFSRGPKAPPPFKLRAEDEPLLFAFVEKICGLVGAPVPREIHLDTQVNASAGFRRGWLSFFGSDLVLVIGLPLVAGMTMRQVAGVLAHEFGHFAQGAGMRFSYIIRSVNAWFARVVYERDDWDEKLTNWAQSEDWYVSLTFKLAQGGVWMGRKILWCLMTLGHAISCFMSREMEYDADSYEAKVAGSSEFPRTAERLRALSAAHSLAMNDAYQTFQSNELPDDITALVTWRESVLPKDVREKLDTSAAESKTKWNYTHPADADRVRAALKLEVPGVFRMDAPATALFAQFDATSRAVTRHYFEHHLEVPIDKVRFRDATRMAQDRQAADDSDKSLDAFYLNHFHFMRIPPVEPGCQGTWREAMQRMQAASTGYQSLLKEFNELQSRLVDQTMGADLIAARFNLTKPSEFGLSGSNASIAEAAMSHTQRSITELGARMSDFESAAVLRLCAALDDWRASQPSVEGRAQLDRLLAVQRALARCVSEIMHAVRASRSLDLLFANAANHSDGALLEQHAKAVAQRVEVAFKQCELALAEVAHPYLDGHPPVLSTLRLPESGDDEFARAMKLAGVCSDALIPLFVRVLGDLCGLALAAEKSFAADATRFQPPQAVMA